jgi:hypothetical protein
VAGTDTPKYDDNRGPRCYDLHPMPSPFPQYAPDGALDDGSSHPPAARSTEDGVLPGANSESATTGTNAADTDGLGLPNSAAEQGFLAELAGPDIGLQPQNFPSWASALIGPLFRGTEVTIK